MGEWLACKKGEAVFEEIRVPPYYTEIKQIYEWAKVQRAEIGYYRSVDEEKELQERLRKLEKQKNDLQEAIRRWRKKAGVDPPSQGPELVKAEFHLDKKSNKVDYYEHYLLPIERNEHLASLAYEWLEQNGWLEMTVRAYFNNGWIAVVKKEF